MGGCGAKRRGSALLNRPAAAGSLAATGRRAVHCELLDDLTLASPSGYVGGPVDLLVKLGINARAKSLQP